MKKEVDFRYDYILTIIIVTYNRPTEAIRAIQSCMPLSDQTELIVWDNNSIQSNSELVKAFCEKQSCRIKYYYSNENLGPGGGKNAAWLLSNSKYVFIMDDDAVIKTHDFFGKLMSYMDNNERVGAAYVNIEEPSTGHVYNCKIRNEQGNVTRTFAYVGGGHIIRKSTFPQENLYPKKFMFGSEEVYASLLIWDNNQEVHEISSLTVSHIPTGGNRILGRQRDLRILVSSYIIKKALYPLCFLPICAFLFYIRIKLHSFDMDECQAFLDEYSNIQIDNRIKLRTMIKLSKLFGFFKLI